MDTIRQSEDTLIDEVRRKKMAIAKVRRQMPKLHDQIDIRKQRH